MFFRRSTSTSQPLSSPQEEGSDRPNSVNGSTANRSNEESQAQLPSYKGKEPQIQDDSDYSNSTTMVTPTSPPQPLLPVTPTKRRSSLEILVTKIRSPRSPTTTQITENTGGSPKNQRIESCSGEDPISHPGLYESLVSPQKASIIHRDTFSCSGGVNLGRLLGATRHSILERAKEAGANCLVDEKWKCVVTGPRRPRRAYKVQIYYSAFAAKLKEDSIKDPHKPVALDRAQGVPGLMTILERQE